MLARVLLFLLIVGSTTVPVFADVFRWVDAQGQVHFSDRRSVANDDSSVERIDIKPNVVRVQRAQPSISRPAERRLYRNDRAVRSVVVSDSANVLRQRRCENAKRNLQHMRSRMRAGYRASEQARLHEAELKYMEERKNYCD